MTNPNLFSEKEAAEYVKLSPGTLQQRRHHSKPPAYTKVGRRVMYLKDDLDTFIMSGRIDPTDAEGDSE